MGPLLGLVIALPGEAKALLGTGRWTRIAGRRVRRFRLPDGTGIACALSGAGTGNALSAARWLGGPGGATALAVLGVSGGLDPSLRAGDLVLPSSVVEDGGEGYAVWSADPASIEGARASLAAEGLPVRVGAIVTSSQARLTPEGKRSLFRNRRALAVDMESAAVARAAGESGLPFFCLRAVCDAADRTVPRELLECLDEDGRARPLFLLRALGRRPSLAFDLARTGVEFAAALSTLGRAWRVQVSANVPARLASRGRGGGPSADEAPRTE